MPENKINAEGVISSFLDQIIAAKGENLSKNERLSLRQELFGELDDKINAAVIAALPDDKMLELNRELDGNASEQEIEEFFLNAGVDFNKVALQTALQFRKDQLRDVPRTKVPVAETVTVTATVAPESAASATEAAMAEAKTSAAEVTATPAELSHDMTQNTVQNNAAAAAPAGAPLQGTTSEVPGMSNVEGIARMVASMSEGGANA